MYFVIEYNRQKGALIDVFETVDAECAQINKLTKEIDSLSEDSNTEIVILEAESIDSLKKSHGRYFGDIKSIKIEQ